MKELGLSSFEIPVYSNVSAEPVTDSEKFRRLLADQISSPVLWYPILNNMHKDGIRHFVEIGPGKVLQGLVKKSIKDVHIDISGVDNLENLIDFLKENAEVKPA